jgi:hypothetical protein
MQKADQVQQDDDNDGYTGHPQDDVSKHESLLDGMLGAVPVRSKLLMLLSGVAAAG